MWVITAFNGTTDTFRMSLIESVELFCYRHKLHEKDIKSIIQK